MQMAVTTAEAGARTSFPALCARVIFMSLSLSVLIHTLGIKYKPKNVDED